MNELRKVLGEIRDKLGQVIRGKDEVLDRALCAQAAGGHLLLEDVPGTGKTTLAKALARIWGLDFARVQFTPDLLPTDILGMNVLDPRDGSFRFREGPIFHRIVLADEINRASPRTQSALLEAMNEGQVTLDNTTRALPETFWVIATQNPVDYQGTYPLPEAQLDRFLMRIRLGYPARDDALKMLFDRRTGDPLDDLAPVAGVETLTAVQAAVRAVHVAEDIARYVICLTEETRRNPHVELGAGPRAALGLFRAAQSAAFLEGRNWVGADDIQRIAEPVLAHRLMLTAKARYSGVDAAIVVREILDEVEVPT